MNIMPILKKFVPAVATAVTVIFTPARPGWATLEESLRAKDYRGAGQSFVASMSGIELHAGGPVEFEAFEAINPIDFSRAAAPKVALWSNLTMEIISKAGTFIRSIWAEVK